MAMAPSINESTQNGMVYAKNVVTNKVERIAVVSGLQVGLPASPNDLQIFGSTSFSTKVVKLLENNEHFMDMNTSYLMVDPNGSTGNVIVYLPPTPRQGQIVSVKDYSGNAAVVSITVNAGAQTQTVEGSYSQTINTKYGFINLIWNGTEWSILSTSSKGIMLFGCSSVRSGGGAHTDFLNPGGISSSAGTSDNRRQPTPTGGTIRNLRVMHNVAGGTSSGSANLTYTVLVNGTATAITVDIDVTSTDVVSNTSSREVVSAGDKISIQVDIPANVNNSPDEIVATFEVVS